MKRALSVLVVFVSAGCGEADTSLAGVSIAVPQALVDCAQPPADTALRARLWISGTAAPCPLTILADGVSGNCDVVAGIERTFTLDWFTVDSSGVDVVLAQARTTLDLTGEIEASQKLVFADDDYVIDECLDMSADSSAGRDVVVVDGSDRAVCDLDNDGDANLVEVCAGRDPLGRL